MADLWQAVRGYLGICLVASVALAGESGPEDWPPQLNGARGGTATLGPGASLNVPGGVAEARGRAGSAAFHIRPSTMRPNGFGLCAFAAIHIPPSER